jgi:hypothetical protein
MQLDTRSSSVSPRSLVLAAMIAFAVAERLVIFFLPGVLPYNFTPVEAIALFGGAYFLDRRLAFLVPLAAMLVSDILIALALPRDQLYFWYEAVPFTYACIALTVLGGLNLRNRVTATSVAGYSFASAVLFFLVSNFGVWLFASHDGSACSTGLIPCYVAGLPFFKGTLLGTLFWSAVLFGGFELMRRRWPTLQPAHA